MYRFVITGGPCSGKTEIMSSLTQKLQDRGYKCLTVPEAATILILNGIHPSPNMTMDEFQSFVLSTQIANEDNFVEAAKLFGEKTVIFYDRGIMDGNAYASSPKVFKKLLASKNMKLADVYNRYDAVLHLVTAADGAEKYYQWNDPTKEDVGNNAARSESPELAREKDKKTLDSWIGHPHLRVFDNSTDFAGKIHRVVKEVFAVIGEPTPMEVERKFLIKKPTNEQIAQLGCISTTQIIQTYLKRGENVAERRIRQRGNQESGFSFYYTEKTDVSDGVRIENERKISQDEYLQYLTEADTNLHQISKTRHCFVYNRQYFEMDIYPFSDAYAILEIELNDINDGIQFPPLSIVSEVTNDAAYRNYNLAATMSLNGQLNINNTPAITTDNNHVEPNDEESSKTTDWFYSAYKDEPEILGSGSQCSNFAYSHDESEALELLHKGSRNTLIRARLVNGKKLRQYWDVHEKQWCDY